MQTRGRLVGLEGPVEGQEFALEAPEIGLGRRSDCEIVISDPSVSRLHARIRVGPTGYVIEDAGSANGTWVNGVRLANPQPLAERDIIRIGKAAFTYHSVVEGFDPPPGSMTLVTDFDEPSPFEEVGPGSEARGAPSATEAAWESAPQVHSYEAVTPRRPSRPVAGPNAVASVREELAALREDLGPFIERLNALADTVSALDEQLDSADLVSPLTAPGAQRMLGELEADGGIERYHVLAGILSELEADPTDLKLLLRLSEQLPSLTRLVRAYLRLTGGDLERDPWR